MQLYKKILLFVICLILALVVQYGQSEAYYSTLVADISGDAGKDNLPTDNRIPLILVHGIHGSNELDFAGNSNDPFPNVTGKDAASKEYFRNLINYFYSDESGLYKKYKLYRFHYESDVISVHDIAGELATRIGQHQELVGKQIVIAAHSMGGLVARSYIAEHGGWQNVIKLITLATPHHGSPLANYGLRFNKLYVPQNVGDLLHPELFDDWSQWSLADDAIYWGIAGCFSCAVDFQAIYKNWNQFNRSDLRYDNFNSLWDQTKYIASDENNDWLKRLNKIDWYDDRLITYYGYIGNDGYVDVFGNMSANEYHLNLAAGIDIVNKLRVASVWLERITSHNVSTQIKTVYNDGAVPAESAYFKDHNVAKKVECKSFDHYDMQGFGVGYCINNGQKLSILKSLSNDLIYIHSSNTSSAIPSVNGFSTLRSSIDQNETISFNFSVTDNKSKLSRIELWRTPDSGGSPNEAQWSKVSELPLYGNIASDYISDTPPAGTFWYGIHVINTAGKMNDERNSYTNGSPGVYGPIKIAVLAPTAETNPPVISSLTTDKSSPLSGVTKVSVNATDDTAVTRVEFYLDNVIKKTCYAAPFNCWDWNTFDSSNAGHTLKAKAYDAANNTAEKSISVSVWNISGNSPPTIIDPLVQYKADGTPLSLGAVITETSVVLKAQVTDSDPNAQLTLDVELRPVGVNFTGNATCTSGPYVGSGQWAYATCNNLQPGGWHWQARARDQFNGVSHEGVNWRSAGGNLESSADLEVQSNTGGGGDTIPSNPVVISLISPYSGENIIAGQPYKIRYSISNRSKVKSVGIFASYTEGCSTTCFMRIGDETVPGEFTLTNPSPETGKQLFIMAFDRDANGWEKEIARSQTVMFNIEAPQCNPPASPQIYQGENWSCGKWFQVHWPVPTEAVIQKIYQDGQLLSTYDNTNYYYSNQYTKLLYGSDHHASGSYNFQVKTSNKCGGTSLSNLLAVNVKRGMSEITGSAPSEGATDLNPRNVALSWSADGCDLKYDVYVCPSSVADATTCQLKSARQSSNSFTLSDLKYDTNYSWGIVAIDDLGYTKYSKTFHFKTKNDITAPDGSILINNGALSTTSYGVTLNLNSSDTESGVTLMRFSNDGINWSPWVYYAATYSWDLADSRYGGAPSQGEHMVFAEFRDASSNVSPIYSAVIDKLAGSPGKIILHQGNLDVYFDSIQAAVDAAEPGQTVYLTEGVFEVEGRTYTPRYPDKYVGVVMKNGVTLMGAGVDKTTLIGRAVYTIVDADDAIIEGMTIKSNSPYNIGYAVLMESQRSTIRHCQIEDGDKGILIGSGGGASVAANAIEVYNNLIKGNTTGIEVNNNASALIFNNTIVANDIGLNLQQAGNANILYNIIADNRIGISKISGTAGISNNNLFNTQANYHGMADQTGTNDNKAVDPLFVDLTLGYYYLSANSPAIDAIDGINDMLYIISRDPYYKGSHYYTGNGPDMGAYEYGAMGSIKLSSNLSTSYTVKGPGDYVYEGSLDPGVYVYLPVPVGVYSVTFATIQGYYPPPYQAHMVRGLYHPFQGNYITDTLPPTGSVTVNYGEYATANTNVTLTLDVNYEVGIIDRNAMMSFSNDQQTWSDPEPFYPVKNWDLLSYGGNTAAGLKTVYAQVSDSQGNWGLLRSGHVLYVPDRQILEVPTSYSSIQSAVDTASNGDIVYVLPGTYEENIVLKAGVTLQGAGPSQTFINKTGSDPIIVRAGPNTMVDGFTIGMTGSWASVLAEDSSAIISNNVIYGFQGVLVRGNSNTVVRNNIFATSGFSVNVDGYGATSSNVAVLNNTLAGDAASPSRINKGLYVSNAGDNSIVHLTNNIITNNSAGVTELSTAVNASTHIISSFNTFWHNTSDLGSGLFKTMGVGDSNADPALSAQDTGHPSHVYDDLDSTRNNRGHLGGPAARTVPVAEYSYLQKTGRIYSFDAGLSLDAETAAEELLVRWDLNGDGIFETPFSHNKAISYRYEALGTYNVSIQVKDSHGYISSATHQITVANQMPDLPVNLSPADGATAQPVEINLRWSGNDPDIEDTVIYDVYFGTTPEPPLVSSGQAPASFSVTSLQPYTAYYWRVISKDNNGGSSVSPVWYFVTGSDDIAPPDGLVIINNGDTKAYSRDVVLSLYAYDLNGVTSMCISEASSCTEWEAFAETRNWTLSAGNGQKTVNVWFADSVGNLMVSPVSDSIELMVDGIKPTGSIVINSGTAMTNVRDVTLALTCSDSDSGCAMMQFSDDGLTWSVPEAYSALKNYTLTAEDGLKTVYVRFSDNAGNLSDAVSATITLAATPTGGIIKLPRTGQITCYDVGGSVINCEGTGQDGEIQAGVAWPNPRFTDNGDETITDNLTGLIWAKDAGTPTFTGSISECTGGAMTWTSALDYVACLNTNNYLGYNDWYLPNINELGSLLINTDPFTADSLNSIGFMNVQLGLYWSSSSSGFDTSNAWYVNMQYGDARAEGGKSGLILVLPVRALHSTNSTISISRTGRTKCYDDGAIEIDCTGTGQDGEKQNGVVWPEPRFLENDTETLLDQLTGLIWTKDSNAPGPTECSPGGIGKTLQEGLDYIKCLNQARYLGYTDWRLPNINELKSLRNIAFNEHTCQTVPCESANDWLISQGFINVPGDSYYTSTTFVSYPGYQRIVYIQYGDDFIEGYHGKDVVAYIWPVRGGIAGASSNILLSVSKTGTGTGAVNSTPSGIACGTACSASFSANSTVTLTATPDAGSTFTGWSGACTGTGTCILTMDAAISVIANFTATILPTGGVVQLPATGQIACYDVNGNEIGCSGTGQDGEIQAGVAWPYPRFTDNGDETITDYLTGLIWAKDAGTPTFTGNISECTGGAMTWTAALDYVTCLNTNNYLGHNDWYLPNINELQSLVNAGHDGAYLLKVFNNIQYYYWSSTTYAGDTYASWLVSMWFDGYVYHDGKGGNDYVWPVREGQSGASGVSEIWRSGQTTSYYPNDDGALQKGIAWPNPRFTDNGDTVADNLTGLMWTKDANMPNAACSPGYYATWQEALDYVACLNSVKYLGYADWRLPNIEELSSLVDRSQSNPALPLDHPFLNAQYGYWSATTKPYRTEYAWLIDMWDGYTYEMPKYDGQIAWPLRGGLIDASGNRLLSVSKAGTGAGTVTSLPPGISCGYTCSSVYTAGTSVTLTAVAIGGSTFTGWAGVCAGTGSCTVTMEVAKDVTAIFEGAAPGGLVQIPQTGQKTCYNSVGTIIDCVGTGQDGELRAGVVWPDPRLSDNGDETITDNLTGLIWTKDAGSPTFIGANSTCQGGDINWQAALDYVKCLNENNYLGLNDWRLPNINEIESLLVNAEQANPAEWLNAKGFTNINPNAYWSSTSAAVSTDVAWLASIFSGLGFNNKYTANAVWPVRGQAGTVGNSIIALPKTGQSSCYDIDGFEISCVGTGQDGEFQAGVAWPTPRFIDNDTTVTDGLTGLIWTKDANAPGPYQCDYGTDKTWQAALDYVSCLNSHAFLGYNDWRLPNVKELRILIDYSKSSPALPSNIFANVWTDLYWSSTSSAVNQDRALYVELGLGIVGYNEKIEPFYIWPVRGGSANTLKNAYISVAPASFNFGNVTVTKTSDAQAFSITNTGAADLVIGAISLTGSNPDAFRISANGCAGQTLSPATSCNVHVTFKPLITGSLHAELRIQYNGLNTPSINIGLSGTGTADTSVLLIENSIQFTFNNAAGDAIFSLSPIAASVQPDGKLLIVGQSWYLSDTAGLIMTTGMVRLNIDDTIDTNFNAPYGFVALDRAERLVPYAVAFGTDGKVVAVGTSWNTGEMFSARFNVDGSLDSSFNSPLGFVMQSGIYADNVAVQSDGKIVVVGSDGTDAMIHRLNSNGSIDTTFNSPNGFITIHHPELGSNLNVLTIQSDEKIVTSGSTILRDYNGDHIVGHIIVRINADGTLDTSFNAPDGYLAAKISDNESGDWLTRIEVLNDGKLLIAGNGSNNNTGWNKPFLIRYNNYGQLDTTFSPKTGFTHYSVSFEHMVKLPNEDIVIYGYITSPYSSQNSTCFFIKYDKDGNPRSFVKCDSNASVASVRSLVIRDQSVIAIADDRIIHVMDSIPQYYPLNVVKSGPVTGTVSADGLTCNANICSGNYSVGAAVTLTATSTTTATFTSWSGACTGTDHICVVSMDSVKNVTALFEVTQSGVVVTINSVNPVSIGSGETSVINWQANGNGDFAIEIGGSGARGSGREIERGAYSTSSSVNSNISCASLSKGLNQLHIYVTDADGITGFASTSINLTQSCIVHLESLQSGSVNPASGDIDTLFTFGVNYTDPNAITGPTLYELRYRAEGTNIWKSLALNQPSGSKTGRYAISTKLPAGNYEYYFQFITEKSVSLRYPEQGFASGLTVNRKNTIISSPTLSSSSIVFGASLVMTGTLKTVDGLPVPQSTVTIELSSPNNSILTRAIQTDTAGNYSLSLTDLTINRAGSWSVRSSFAGNGLYSPSSSSNISFIVQKGVTSLSMVSSSNAIRLGNAVDLSGEMTPNPYSGADLTGQMVVIYITDPHDNLYMFSTETDAQGKYGLSSYSGFNTTGKWTVQAEFIGSSDYEASASGIVSVFVKQVAGYAVIVQGRNFIEGVYEGITEHNATTNYVYNRLKERGFTDDDIVYLNYNLAQPGVDALPSKASLQNAISTWARQKMVDVEPAPLYIIFVGHGEAGKFFVYPDGGGATTADTYISPTELDTWITSLETGLRGTAAEGQKIIFIYGACNSGSFINTLSGATKPDRIIIASADENELSLRGISSPNNIRDGEFFISSFFRYAAEGLSLGNAFRASADETEDWSMVSGRQSSNNDKYHDTASQHPLLDDNNDAIGSNILYGYPWDGSSVDELFLGFSTNSGTGVRITEVTPTTTLVEGAAVPALFWAKVNDISRISEIWMEVRYQTQISNGLTIDLVKIPWSNFNSSAGRYEWLSSDISQRVSSFLTLPGKYELLYYAEDNQTGEIAPFMRTVVYRGINSKAAPLLFDLLSPAYGVTLQGDRVVFTWSKSTDPDGDALTYDLEFSTDPTFAPVNVANLKYFSPIYNGETQVSIIMPFSQGPYYWRVWAVNSFGKKTVSNQTGKFYNIRPVNKDISVKISALDAVLKSPLWVETDDPYYHGYIDVVLHPGDIKTRSNIRIMREKITGGFEFDTNYKSKSVTLSLSSDGTVLTMKDNDTNQTTQKVFDVNRKNALTIQYDIFFVRTPCPSCDLTVIKTGNGTVTSAPSGISCGQSCTSSTSKFTNGIKVTLKAVESDPLYYFNNWGNGCLSITVTGECTVLVDDNKSINATFTKRTATISLTNLTPTMGKISVDGTIYDGNATLSYDYGTSKRIDFKPNSNYRIKHIKVDGQSIGKPFSYTFTNLAANHTVSVEFEPDLTASIFINNNSPYTNNRLVSLNLTCALGTTPCLYMKFSYDGSTYTAPEAFSNTYSTILNGSDGEKTVYVKFMDSSNTWTGAYSDNILLDTTKPTVTSQPVSGINVSTVTLNCSDGAGSGCKEVRYTKDGTEPTLSSQLYNSAISITDATIIKFIALDNAGNQSLINSSAFNDQVPPTGAISIDSGAASTKSMAVILTLACSDNTSCKSMAFSNDGQNFTAAEPYSTMKVWLLTPGNGSKTVYVKFMDAVENWAAPVTDTIDLLMTAPVDSVAPEQVTTLTLHDTPNDEGSSISLDWSGYARPSDFSLFKIYRSNKTFADVTLLSPIFATKDVVTTYLDNTAANGKTYYYAVTALDDSGNENVAVFSAGPAVAQDNVSPPAVTTFNAFDTPNDTGNSITMSWDGYQTPADFKEFRIYQNSVPFSTITGTSLIKTLSDKNMRSYKFTDWSCHIPNYYAITAVDISGNEDPVVSSVGPVTCRDNIPPVVTVLNVDPASIGNNGVSIVSWKSSGTGTFIVDIGGTDINNRGKEIARGDVLGTDDYYPEPIMNTEVRCQSLLPGENQVRLYVTDNNGNVGTAVAVVNLAEPCTSSAILTNGTVAPESGDIDTNFRFSVSYLDEVTAGSPFLAEVRFKSETMSYWAALGMQSVVGGSTGAYEIASQLPAGNYKYYYQFITDSNVSLRFPPASIMDMTVNVNKRNSALTAGLNPASLTLGSPVQFIGSLKSANGLAVPFAPVTIELIAADGSKSTVNVQTDANGLISADLTNLLINKTGIWKTKAIFSGNDMYYPSNSSQLTFTVIKSGTSLQLSLLSQAILAGDTIQITGKLKPQPDWGGKLAAMPLNLAITDPAGRIKVLSYTTDNNGEYSYNAPLDLAGRWTVEVSFAGNNDYLSSASGAIFVDVMESAGYALLVQGNNANNGLNSHNESAKYIHAALLKRGFSEANINYLNFDSYQYGVDGIPGKAAIADALQIWAKDKMINLSRPLYVIFAGSGSVDNFSVGSETITSAELDAWLTSLQDSLSTSNAKEQKIVFVAGFSNSGSFIDNLSSSTKKNRIIITSSWINESSVTRPDGDYFTNLFFNHAGKGKSLKNSFNAAVADLNKVRMPLLEDNKDGLGSNIANPTINNPLSDGFVAADIYLGFSNFNSSSEAEIVEVSPEQILSASDTTMPDIWAKVNDISRVGEIWLELRTPDEQYLEIDGQLMMDLPVYYPASIDEQTKTYSWTEIDSATFNMPGTYELFFFVKDIETNGISSLKRAYIIRQKEGNIAPSEFDLTAPDDGAYQHTVLDLSWTGSNDPEGDMVKYKVLISRDATFATVDHMIDNLDALSIHIDEEVGLTDLTRYYWQVIAMDEFGAVRQSSQVWSFNTTNGEVPAVVKGKITTIDGVTPIGGALIRTSLGEGTISDVNGSYLLQTLQSGNISITVSREGYNALVDNAVVASGEVVFKDIILMADIIAPETSITAKPASLVNINSASFSFSSSEEVLSFECQFDSNSWEVCSSPKLYSGISDGSHTFNVRATDLANITDATPASWTWSVDLTAPNAPVVSGTTPTADTTPTWTWTSGGGGNGTYRYQLDSEAGAWTETTDLAYTPETPLSFGTHTLYVQERDDAGNWSASGSRTIMINSAPTAENLTPSAVTSPVGTLRTVAALYRDSNGATDLKAAEFLINRGLNVANAIRLSYNRAVNKLYLYNDAGSAVVGSCTPGVAGTLQNTQGILDCGATTVTAVGTDLTVNWSITPKTGGMGYKNMFMKATDNSNANTGWQAKGTWTVTSASNVAPAVVSLTPTALGSSPDTVQLLTAVYRDQDGVADFKAVEMLINGSLTSVNGVRVSYSRSVNRLYLYNDAGTAAVGSCTPGVAGTIQNTQAILDCGATTVSANATDQTVNMRITPMATFTGSKKMYLQATDNSNAVTGWIQKGTWTIGAAQPSVMQADFTTFIYGTDSRGSYTNIEQDSLARKTEDISLVSALQEIGIMLKQAEGVLLTGSYQIVRHSAAGIESIAMSFDGAGGLMITDDIGSYWTAYTADSSTGAITMQDLKGQISPDGQVIVLMDANSPGKEEALMLVGVRAGNSSAAMSGRYEYVEIRQQTDQWTTASGTIEMAEGQQTAGTVLITDDGSSAIVADKDAGMLRIYLRQKLQ